MGLVSAIARVPDYLLAVARTCNYPRGVTRSSWPGHLVVLRYDSHAL